MNLFEDLKWRGLIDNYSSDDLIEKINNGELTFYIGVDPTADSIHIGHLCSLLTAKRLEKAGNKSIILAGGGTGLIGDPKPTVERSMITKEEVSNNIECMRKQFKDLVGFDTIVNNFDWLGSYGAIDYLRDYGKYFNINYMLAKETVKRRLDIGITYTEFSYMILQSIDYLNLYEKHNCTLQIGGQDQWGNITAGMELIRKKHPEAEVFALTMPLITKSDGTKFGKTESGAVWLDKNKTSSYELYQFFYNAEDEKVIEYLKKYTFLSKEEIDALEEKVQTEPHLREAQKTLAKEILTFAHGEKAFNKALNISEALFTGNISNLSKEEIEEGFKDVPTFEVKEDINIVDLLIELGAASSKREAREFVSNNAVSLNEEKINDENFVVNKDASLASGYAILRRGKKKYFLLKF